MKIVFLGSGSAFTVGTDNFQSNMLLQVDANTQLLIDCGTDIRFSLHQCGLAYEDITDVYISHLHADHAGGLEGLGFSAKFVDSRDKPKLYTSEALVDDLWNKVLAGGMRSLEGTEAELSTYFNVHPLVDEKEFVWHGIAFQLIKTEHIMSGSRLMPSYGLFFEIDSKKVFLTTDTQFTPEKLNTYYEQADVIFHDCETTKKRSTVHANFEELKTLDEKIKQKMWLYHYNPGDLPDAKKVGFRGFVTRGQVFDFEDEDSLK